MFSITLKLLAKWYNGIAWRLRFHASYETIHFGAGILLSRANIYSDSVTKWYSFYHSQDSWPVNQEVQMWAIFLTIILNDPLARFLLSHLHNLGLCWFSKVSVPKGGLLAPEDTIIVPLNWKLRLLPGHFGLLFHWNNRQRRRLLHWLWLILIMKEKVDFYLYYMGREEYAWNLQSSL